MFEINARDEAEAVLLTVSGDIDLVTVEEFCRRGLEAIAQAGDRPVVIDAAGVTFIDSTGLSGLVTLNNAAAGAGTMLTLRAVSSRMASMLRITALDSVIPLTDALGPKR